MLEYQNNSILALKKKSMKTSKPSFNKIKKVLDSVWKSPYSSFYRNKYNKIPINLSKDINSLEDFLKLPYLTKNEMIQAGPYERLYIPQNKITGVVVTSGTTTGGISPYVSFKAKNNQAQQNLISSKTKQLKIKRAMALRKVLGRNLTGMELDFMLVMGDLNNLLASAKLASQIKIDALYTTATILYFFLPYLKKEYDLKNIKYIRLGGEYASEKRIAYLKKYFTSAYFDLGYGCSEAQRIAYRCKYLDKMPPKFFHFIPLFLYETINPEEESELVITHLDAKNLVFPLIRYKTGDSVKIENINCPCGEAQRMEVIGRIGYDLVKISGTAIYVDYVYKAIEPFKKYLSSPEWQLHLYEEEKGELFLPKLKLQLIAKTKKETNLKELQNLLEKGIAQNLYLSAKATLADLIEKKAFLPLEIEFVPEFPVGLKKKHIISHLI